MADSKVLEKLEEGIVAWNQWKKDLDTQAEFNLDLSDADLEDAELQDAVRIGLTLKVIPLREEEDRSGFTPELRGTSGYGWLSRVHSVIRWVFWLSISLSTYNSMTWISSSVWLPN